MVNPTADQIKEFNNAKGRTGYKKIEVAWSSETGAPRLIRGFKDLQLAKLNVNTFLSDKEQLRRWLRNPAALVQLSQEVIDLIEANLAGLYCQTPSDFSVGMPRIDLDPRHHLTVRLQQTAVSGSKVIPVHRYGLTVHIPDALSVSRITGLFAAKVTARAASMTEADAADRAKHVSGVQGLFPGHPPSLVYLPTPSGYPLAWRCLVKMPALKGAGPTVPCIGEMFIGDSTGQVLRLLNLVSCFWCTGVPYYPRRQDNPPNPPVAIEAVRRGNEFLLEDGTRYVTKERNAPSGVLIRTKRCRCTPGTDLCACTPLSCPSDCQRQGQCPAEPDPCTCSTSASATEAWGADRSIEVESHVNTGRFFQFMRDRFKHEGVSVCGPDTCELCVLHDSASTSFFYPPGAYSGLPYRVYIPSGSKGVDGSVVFDAFCARDIIAHEWTHAVIDALFGPEGLGYEGAIREGLCDAFASFFLSSQGMAPWLLGNNWSSASRKCYRNMASPRNGEGSLPLRKDFLTRSRGARSSYVLKMVGLADDGVQPDHFESRVDPTDNVPRSLRDSYDALCDWARVNSGIVNKATWLMCEGGRHGATGGPLIAVQKGLGMDLQMRLYYRMLGLSSCYSFEAMRDELLGFLWDEQDLVQGWDRSLGSPEDRRRRLDYLLKVAAVINAFSAVGVPEGDTGVTMSTGLLAAGQSDQLAALHDPEMLSLTGDIGRRYPAVQFPEWF